MILLETTAEALALAKEFFRTGALPRIPLTMRCTSLSPPPKRSLTP